MKTWICHTLANLFGPTQGAARVYAYLKKEGYDIHLKDFNQDAFFTLLSKKYLEITADKIINVFYRGRKSKFFQEELGSILLYGSNKVIARLIAKGILSHSLHLPLIQNYETIKRLRIWLINSRINHTNILHALLSEKEFIISEIDKARETLDKNFLNLEPEEFLKYFQILLCGKALIDAAYFPSQLDFGFGFYGGTYSSRAEDIIYAINNERCNFLIPYYRNEVMPLLDKEQPDVVGISITHPSEFIPAFTLAHLIKLKQPQVHICLGGSTLTEIAHRIVKNPPLLNLFDSIVLGPGECAFGKLIECIEHKEDLSSVPNLMYKENSVIKKSQKIVELDLNDTCTPEYGTLRPKSMLLLETSSGCYWGKCLFCSFPTQGTSSFTSEYQDKRSRRIELVLEDIQRLKDIYDPFYIFLTDSSLSPKRIEQIAEYNLKTDKKIHFASFFRFEKEFMSLAFCEKIAKGGFLGGMAGLESGSQRINDIMNKDVDIKDVKIIIKNFHKAGIPLLIHTMVGVPTETMEESLMTLRFIKKWRHLIVLDWTVHSFNIPEYCQMPERATEFGLKIIPMPDNFLLPFMEYKVERGPSRIASINLAMYFYEQLRRHMHPLSSMMGIELYRAFILAQKAKGISPKRLKIIAKKIM